MSINSLAKLLRNIEKRKRNRNPMVPLQHFTNEYAANQIKEQGVVPRYLPHSDNNYDAIIPNIPVSWWKVRDNDFAPGVADQSFVVERNVPYNNLKGERYLLGDIYTGNYKYARKNQSGINNHDGDHVIIDTELVPSTDIEVRPTKPQSERYNIGPSWATLDVGGHKAPRNVERYQIVDWFNSLPLIDRWDDMKRFKIKNGEDFADAVKEFDSGWRDD